LVCYIRTYVIILVGIFPLTSPQPKYWRGCVPGIPGGVDASGCTVNTGIDYWLIDYLRPLCDVLCTTRPKLCGFHQREYSVGSRNRSSERTNVSHWRQHCDQDKSHRPTTTLDSASLSLPLFLISSLTVMDLFRLFETCNLFLRSCTL